MSVPQPLAGNQVPEAVQRIFDNLQKLFGVVPNFFGVLARNPAALQTFLPFYQAVMQGGKIDGKYKELAYLKASVVNGCEY